MCRALVVAGLTIVLIACSRDDRRESAVAEGRESAAADMGGPARAPVAFEAQAPPPPPAPAPGGQSSAAPADSLAPAMIIRTGTAEVEVEVLEPAVDSVRALITRLGGHIVDLHVQSGRSRGRDARLVVRIPADRFDGAVAGLEQVGDVEAVNVSAQDVGEEYVDVQAQLANRRRLEARLLELLDNRTGRLEEVLAVERELARVREEIDRQEGRLRYLRNRVSLSTLTILLHEPAPLISNAAGENVFRSAVRAAWRNFIGFIVFVISSLGVLVPLAVLLWVLWLVARRVRRRRRGAPDV